MKVVITGATGFLGRNLAESFNQKEINVKATGRSAIIGDELTTQGIDYSPADIEDFKQIRKAVGPADVMIHCAGKSGPWGKYRDFHGPNVNGTRNVIKACRLHNIKKIIFISSPSIYYNGEDRYNVFENDPLEYRQASAYSKTKLISETEISALQEEGFKTIIFRPRALYGPYEKSFIPRILRLAENKKVMLINGGKALVDITCIENFIDAIFSAINTQDKGWNQIYNISNGDPISVKRWFSLILNIFDRPFKCQSVPEVFARTIAALMEFMSYMPMVNKEPPMTRFTVGYLSKSMTLNIDKAKSLLNYFPRVSNEEGFMNYKKWVQSS